MSRGSKPPGKDMYWFAHGGAESEKNHLQRNAEGDDDVHGSGSPTWNTYIDRKGSPEDLKVNFPLVVDGGSSSSGPSSLEREDKLRAFDKRVAVEERRKQLWEAEQERNDAVLRKHMEREAALEARRNAQRSNISFAFGSSVPRNVETLHSNEMGDFENMSRSSAASGLLQREENHSFLDRRSVSPLNSSGNTFLADGISHWPNSSQSCTSYSERKIMPPSSWLIGSGALIGEDVMSKSMHAAMPSAARGRRKNDLMPTVPYERNPTPRPATSSSTRKRSVSMTRLDQLAQPRKHYLEANKSNSTASSGASSMLKDNLRSPTRPLSSASEHSGGSGRVPGTVTRRVRSSPRKPRPVSIAGTMPDPKVVNVKPFEAKLSPVKRSYTPSKRTAESNEVKKAGTPVVKNSTPKFTEKPKPTPRPTTVPKQSIPKSTVSKPSTPKSAKETETKQSKSSTPKTPTPKVKEKTSQPLKKKIDLVVSSPPSTEAKEKIEVNDKSNESASVLENDAVSESEKNNAKRIISEEEAKAALAEKRRLAREQAEREAELERQRQEELKREEEERFRKEEEEHRKMEEEQIRLLEEHRRQEEEKLRKAIEDQEQKEEEERAKRDEELRLKAKQEKKAKEEAEKQRLELEEKLRKEEEERAERKKRLEKIMSRTRGKSSGTSPSGSISGSDQMDSAENPHEGFSSGANSLDSNETGELPSEPTSMNENLTKADISSAADSLENNPTYEIGSDNASLNSNDLMMPTSETASQDNSLVSGVNEEVSTNVDASSSAQLTVIENQNVESVSSPCISEHEDVSVFTSSSSTLVPMATQLENSSVLASESQVSENEDVQTSHISEDPLGNVKTEDRNIESQVPQPASDNEQLIMHDDVEEIGVFDTFASKIQHSEGQVPLFMCDNIQETGISDSYISNDNAVKDWHQNREQLEVEEYPQESTEFKENTEYKENLSPEKSDMHAAFSSQNYSLTTNEHLNSEVSSNTLDAAYPLEPELLEVNARSSISSDLKLPDPIYETSDEGSFSSEKQLPDFKLTGHEEFNFVKNVVSDDVFSEQPAEINSEFSQQSTFGESEYLDKPNQFTEPNDDDSIQRSRFDHLSSFDETNKNVTDERYVKKSFTSPDVLQQTLASEIIAPSQSSTPTVIETSIYPIDSDISYQSVNPFNQDMQGNKENIESENFNTLAELSSQSEDNRTIDTFDIYSNKENIFSPQISSHSREMPELEDSTVDIGPSGDNPFIGVTFSDTPIFQLGHNVIQPGSALDFETVDKLGSQIAVDDDPSSKLEELSDVTYIKDDGSGACIGIISSVEHDHVSNDFPQQNLHNEQLKNNFEYPSVTDSEDSSLDSNLSQVMTVENSEKDTIGGLNHVEESSSSNLLYSNGEQHNNPFATEHTYNHGSISQTNGSSFSASEVFSNGHGLQSSKQVSEGELHDYMKLDGNDILSVDHSKNNMYENVDAIDYSKVSPDPFLAKGNSKQISGNPFLLQDDQNKVLLTPDFLN